MARAKRSAESNAGRTRPRVIIRTPYPGEPYAPKPSAILRAVRDELLRVDRATGKIEVLNPKPSGTLSLELASGRVVRPLRAGRPARRARRSGR